MSSDSSYKTKIDELEKYCVSAIARLGKWISEEKNKCQKCYYIGQEITYKEILLTLQDFDSSEQKTKEGVRQIPNTNGKDRTDIVKSSQLGFEVPEVGKQGEAS